MAISEHVLRVVPKADSKAPGFLFAFLSSAPVQMIIAQKVYGSVVQHIEPEHLEDLPVPVPDDQFARRIHGLIDGAASARTEAAGLLSATGLWFDQRLPRPKYQYEHARAIGLTWQKSLHCRLDAFHHSGWAAEGSVDGVRVSTLAQVINTARVPRVYAERGLPFLSGIDVFRLRPVVRERLAAHVAQAFGAIVKAGQLAVQGSGQRYGLLGRIAYVGARLDGWSASHDLFRLDADDPAVAARLFAFFRSDVGRRAMLRHSYGTSIPHVNPAGIAAVRVPETPVELDNAARRALELREQADADEECAIREVEQWLAS